MRSSGDSERRVAPLGSAELGLADLGRLQVDLSKHEGRASPPIFASASQARILAAAAFARRLRRGRRTLQHMDRPLRFVIETHEPIRCEEVHDRVVRAMDPPASPAALGNAMRVEALFPGADPDDQEFRLANYYLLILPVSERAFLRAAKNQPGVLFDIAYQLRKACDFIRVDPDHAHSLYSTPNQCDIPGCCAGAKAAPDKRDWCEHLINYFSIPEGHNDGKGILIGHLDTGHTDHPELNRDSAFRLNNDRDVLDDDDNASDPMANGGSHGTSTACIITSAHGTTVPNENGGASSGVHGLAPAAKIVSVRCAESVVLLWNVDIVQAVWYASEQRVHVITMSLGGYPPCWLRSAIAFAVRKRNIVVTAAAGNCWPWVVFPAGYDECIAVGGCNDQSKPWTGSARGKAIDISAPAENVWVASFDHGRPVVQPSEGTSFASPHVAGVAALWLALHGRDNLINRYRDRRIPLQDVFRRILAETARVPDEWDTAQDGPGILDAAAVLNRTLPDPSDFTPSPEPWTCPDPAKTFTSMHPDPYNAERALKGLIRQEGAAMEQFMDDFGVELTRLIMESRQAWEDFQEASEVAAHEGAAEAQDAVQSVADDVVGMASDGLATVAGWLGL